MAEERLMSLKILEITSQPHEEAWGLKTADAPDALQLQLQPHPTFSINTIVFIIDIERV